MDLSLRMIQLFSFNPLQVGSYRASDVTVEHNDKGELTEYRFWIPVSHYTIMDTDYSTYAIAYECSENLPQILNYNTDDVHIFTRSETVTTAQLDAWKTIAESKIAGSKARMEDLEQT